MTYTEKLLNDLIRDLAQWETCMCADRPHCHHQLAFIQAKQKLVDRIKELEIKAGLFDDLRELQERLRLAFPAS